MSKLDDLNIFPEYFIILAPLFNDVIKSELDEWLYLMKHSEVKEDFKSPYMKKIAECLSILKMTPQEQVVYVEYMSKSLKDRDYYNSANEKGREEGRAEVAVNMLKSGTDVDFICQVTGLSEEQVKTLINK